MQTLRGCTLARFHADAAGCELRHTRQELGACELLADHHIPVIIDPVQLKHIFC